MCSSDLPSTDYVTVVPPAPVEEEVLLRVTNLAGQVLLCERRAPAERYTVTVSDLPAGIYVLHLQGSHFRLARKMVVGR